MKTKNERAITKIKKVLALCDINNRKDKEMITILNDVVALLL